MAYFFCLGIIIFGIISEHIDEFVPSWYEFTNVLAVVIRLLYPQPSVNNHFHFPVIVESATSQMLLQQSK
jgi:hypothetical protein